MIVIASEYRNDMSAAIYLAKTKRAYGSQLATLRLSESRNHLWVMPSVSNEKRRMSLN